MKTRIRQNRHAFRLFAGGCALVLYVGAASPLGVRLAALAGSFDPDHRALVQADLGSTRLVLHHEQNCAAHQHRLVARALTLFAEPASAGQPDHVLQVRTANAISQRTQLSAPSPAQLDQPVLAVNATPAWPAREDFPFSVPTPAPPEECGQLRCLRSILLRL